MGVLPQLLINSIVAGATYSMVALGFNLIFSTTKFINFSYGILIAVGGYVVYFLNKEINLNIYLGVLIGIGVTGLIGYTTNMLMFSPLRGRHASHLVELIASIGVFTAIQGLITLLFSNQAQSISLMAGWNKTFTIFGAIVTLIQITTFLAAVLIIFCLSFLLSKTTFGKTIRAISADYEIATILGINTNKIIAYIFFIGSAIAGFAGILVSFDVGVTPDMGLRLLFRGITAAIIGGANGIYGVALSAFLIGAIENFSIWKISGEWKDAITFAALILFLFFRAQKKQKTWH